MTDAVTSESSDVSTSSSVNATTTETSTGSLAGHAWTANPVIVRVTILLILTVFNLGGNGFTLLTIRLTPRLWTKTNLILASLLVSDIVTGICMLWYTPFLLVVYVFNNPCSYNVAIAVTTPLFKATGLVSAYHLILISVERYVAIVYPLHYESRFTDRTLKWALFAAWVIGILVNMTWLLWLINADLSKCDLVPAQFHLLDVVFGYIPVCISMIICYGKIILIAWRQRQRIESMNANPAAGASAQATSVSTQPSTQSNKADSSEDQKQNSLADTGPPTKPDVTSGTSSAEIAQQQRQQIKSRRREFKAVYLTAAIVGAFVVLWFPYILGHFLASVYYDPVVVGYLQVIGGATGVFNYAFSWAIHAAVSKSYRRAYRQVLVRIGCCCCKNVTVQADNSLIA